MKIRYLLLLAFVCSALALKAQDFEILKVEALLTDMSAKKEMKTDQDGRKCALFRIATKDITPAQREGFYFNADMGSEVVERANRDGEIWLWVSPGLKYLRIKHKDLGNYELYLLDHVARVEPLNTYKIVIKGTMPIPGTESEVITQQYLVFQISPANAMLEVDGQLWEVGPDGTAMKFVDYGTYSYRVQAPNYFPETGEVTVNDPDNATTQPVRLKSDFVEVTLKVDADAEIWVNNEKKGTRTWTGALGKGTYRMECKQAGHETSMISKEITATMNGQTITLPAPKPVYGSLNVESTPIGATIYIDGKEMGKTPKYINQMLVGQHEIRLDKEGYTEHKETVAIVKGERKQVKVEMNTSAVSSTIVQEDKGLEMPQKMPKGSYLTMSGHSNDFEVSYGKQVNSYLKFTGGIGVSFPFLGFDPDFFYTREHEYLLFADALIGTPRYPWSFYAKLRASYYYSHSSYYDFGSDIGNYHSSNVAFRLFPGIRYKNLSLEIGEFGYRIGLDEATTSLFLHDFFVFQFNYHIPLKGDAKATHLLRHYKSSGHYLRLFGGNRYIAAAYGYRFNPYLMLGGGIGNSLKFSSDDYSKYGLKVFADAKVSTPGDKWSLFAQLETIYSFVYFKNEYLDLGESRSSWEICLVPGISYKDISLSIGSVGYSTANGCVTASLLNFTLAYEIPLRMKDKK